MYWAGHTWMETTLYIARFTSDLRCTSALPRYHSLEVGGGGVRVMSVAGTIIDHDVMVVLVGFSVLVRFAVNLERRSGQST